MFLKNSSRKHVHTTGMQKIWECINWLLQYSLTVLKQIRKRANRNCKLMMEDDWRANPISMIILAIISFVLLRALKTFISDQVGTLDTAATKTSTCY